MGPDSVCRPEDFSLCYIDGPWAWFTSAPMAHQWGDDWDDAPYEHNAGSPYEWRESMRGRGILPYELRKVAWDGPLWTPADLGGLNSQWSVEAINHGATAWLSWSSGIPMILAGTPLPTFVELIVQSGGHVYGRFG